MKFDQFNAKYPHFILLGIVAAPITLMVLLFAAICLIQNARNYSNITYDGHLFIKSVHRTVPLVHHPDCPKCK